MIDETIPVLLRLKMGDRQSVCIAMLSHEDGHLYAEPTTIDPAFHRFPSIVLDEQLLQLEPGIAGAKPMYHYRDLIVLNSL